ncbi:MAG: hypothetical protein LH614_05425 [Pyrinomonadaceae bacterium]|nr:hypothetical protein [Pyrinomonadaceae bacterium]
MKGKFTVALFLIFALCSTAFPQDKCRSAAQVFGDVYKKWGEVIIASGCIAGVNLGTGGIAMPLTLECIRKADKYAEAVEDMVKFFNANADNGRWTIGPRRIEWGKAQTGAVVSTFSRVFISAAPVDKDSITVKVKKIDGKAQADVIICKVDEKGNFVKLAQVEFDKGNDNEGEEITKTVSGVKGHLVQVRIDADSVVSKFEYKLTVSK